MKNIFSFFACLIIAMVLSSVGYAQERVVIDTLLRTKWNQYPDNPVMMPGTQSWWNNASSLSPTVFIFKDTLRMLYVGSNAYGFNGTISIGYAWSLDGIAWQQYPNNPVLSPQFGHWEYPHYDFPHVIVDGDTLRMWYGGGNMIGTGMRVGYATSVDCINWDRYPKPVIEPNAAWNKDGVLPGGVIKEDSIFKMWFGGGVQTAGYPSQASQWNIGYATSFDGIHWTLLDDPVISHGKSGDFDVNEALGACVTRSDSGYDMWYFGHNSVNRQAAIGYARSEDGINWTKYYNNPVLRSASLHSPWAQNYYDPSVYFDGEIFHMWFTGWDHDSQLIAIGYATSDTGQYVGIVDNLLVQVPEEYKLSQNYPNPFNTITTISYTIPQPCHVTLKIFDIFGNEIETWINEEETAGAYRINFNASNLSSGIYFYRLKAGNYEKSISMILLK
jgi:predicted GH43/DUF377 family glycosyl hydrolase